MRFQLSTTAAMLLALAVLSAGAAGFVSGPVSITPNLTERIKKGQCGSFCRFRLCKVDGFDTLSGIGRGIKIRDTGIAIPPFVCRKDIRLGTVLENGEALVTPLKGNAKLRPISKYRPKGLEKRFAKDYFGLFQISFPPLAAGKIGIGRRSNRGNQDDFAGELCAVIPITKYTIVNKKGKTIKTIAKTDEKDCVSFTTITSKLLIEFTWDSPDDFDMVVEEPDGTIISKDNLRSKNGGILNRNNGVNACKKVLVGKEQVTYKKNGKALKGDYKVTLIHRSNCGIKRTKWSLYVISEGNLLAGQTGVSNKDNGAVVGTVNFSFKP